MSRSSRTLKRFSERRPVLAGLLFAIGAAAAMSCAAQDAPAPAADVAVPNDSTDLAVETAIPPLPAPAGPALWLDLDGDAARFASAKAARAVVDTAAEYGFKRIILDVKKTDGSVLFDSRNAPRAPVPGSVLDAFADEAGKKGIETVIHFDVFVEGNLATKTGPAFDHPNWQTIVDVENRGLMPQAEYPQGGAAVFVNPCRSDVQMYEASVFGDLLTALKPTTVILDEVRFHSKAADYSDTTRIQFESWIGLGPGAWPGSVIDKKNPRYVLWMTYRAGVITEFVKRLRRVRDRVSPDTRFAMAVPGYYEPAVDLGINWIYSGYQPRLWFADARFRRFGLADHLDEMVIVARDTNPFVVRDITKGSIRGTMNHLPLTVALPVRGFAGRPSRFRECLQNVYANGLSVAIMEPDAMAADGLWQIFREETLAARTKP